MLRCSLSLLLRLCYNCRAWDWSWHTRERLLLPPHACNAHAPPPAPRVLCEMPGHRAWDGNEGTVRAGALMRGSCWRRAMAALARSPARRLGGGGASSLRNVTASLPVLEGLSTVVATGRWRSCLLGLRAAHRPVWRVRCQGMGTGAQEPRIQSRSFELNSTHTRPEPPPPLRRLAWPGVSHNNPCV